MLSFAVLPVATTQTLAAAISKDVVPAVVPAAVQVDLIPYVPSTPGSYNVTIVFPPNNQACILRYP